jgi:hypothetical protein
MIALKLKSCFNADTFNNLCQNSKKDISAKLFLVSINTVALKRIFGKQIAKSNFCPV